MTSRFALALIVAAVAGVAAALMSGLVVRSSAPMLLLTMLAPAPLMIAGFGWHPLVAALGGLVACLLALHVNSDNAALMLAGLVALPSFLVTALALKRFTMLAQRPARDGKEMGGIGVLLVILLALAGVGVAMAVEPDFNTLAAKLRNAIEASINQMSGTPAGLPAPAGGSMAQFYDLFARIMLPLSALVTLTTLVISATLGAQLAERAGLMAYQRPDFRRFAVPGGGLILVGLSLLVAMRAGYLGAFGDAVLAGMLFLFLLQGLAVLHVRSLDWSARWIVLFFAWGSLIIFGFPAFLFMLVGMLDHLLDFRRGRL